jgi:predicted  nucleic acid-binding Zn-ribbon protein
VLYDKRRASKSPDVQRTSAENHFKKSKEKIGAAETEHKQLLDQITKLQKEASDKEMEVANCKQVVDKAEASLDAIVSQIGSGLGVPDVSEDRVITMDHVKSFRESLDRKVVPAVPKEVSFISQQF